MTILLLSSLRSVTVLLLSFSKVGDCTTAVFSKVGDYTTAVLPKPMIINDHHDSSSITIAAMWLTL